MQQRVLGVLAGGDYPARLLGRWAESADVIYAADGGADRLLEIGRASYWLVGDLDSASEKARDVALGVFANDDQETTDCDKLLKLVEANGHASVTLTNVEGDLTDHFLGSLSSAAKSPLRVRLIVRRGEIHVLHPQVEATFTVRPGMRVSLSPLTICHDVDLSGVKWPLQGAELSPVGRSSISNIAEEDSVRVTIGSGVGLLFIAREADEVPWW